MAFIVLLNHNLHFCGIVLLQDLLETFFWNTNDRVVLVAKWKDSDSHLSFLGRQEVLVAQVDHVLQLAQ